MTKLFLYKKLFAFTMHSVTLSFRHFRIHHFIITHFPGCQSFRNEYLDVSNNLSIILVILLLLLGDMGITAGVHRLWSHRSYKATLPLRIFLMIANCLIAQVVIYEIINC